MSMRVLQVCAEIFPLLKTGGLADVAGALPLALRSQGVDARLLLPGFAPIVSALDDVQPLAELPAHGALPPVRLLRGVLSACGGLVAYVIDAPSLYQRAGGPYADAQQQPWADNPVRFAALGWAAAELAQGLDASWRPALVHAHDWHAGLAPACIRALGADVATVFTVHNLAYQGDFDGQCFADLGLPPMYFQPDGLEFWGRVNYMKAGLYFADRITTVSPTYALEIQRPDQGMGLDGLLRARASRLRGVLNGVDAAVWNPATDPLIPHRYDARRLAGKARCKASLQQHLGLDEQAGAPLFCVVSRLTEQKGLHLVLEALPALVARGAQFALLGSGDAGMEAAFRQQAGAHPRAVAVHIGYDEPFAHQLVAGADVIMVPSRFEPCGLTQLYGLAYGTLPLVRRVGGLADTVTDCSLENLADGTATGVVFDTFSAQGLDAAVRRALALYRRRADWKAVQRQAMAQRHDWSAAAGDYLAVYQAALAD